MNRLETSRPPRRREPFNHGWRFTRGDPPDASGPLDSSQLGDWLLPMTQGLSCAGAKAPPQPNDEPPTRASYLDPDFDDSDWRLLDLPHDWGIEGPFDQALPGETGKLPWAGVGWYRKRFRAPRRVARRKLELRVDGAMAYSSVWLNGKLVGGWPYGYTSFVVDLSPHVRAGGDNVIAIRLDNPKNSSRWYPGSGLYRNVWIVETPAVRLSHDGVFVTTPRVSEEAALVTVDVEVENRTQAAVALRLDVEIRALKADGTPSARPAARAESIALDLDEDRAACRSATLRLKRPRLWSLKQTNRYVAVVTLGRRTKNGSSRDAAVLDRRVVPFGVRSVRLCADGGFFLNEERITLNGVCQHHDLGALGAALSPRALERQVEILQEMGCNAIRTAHNPPAPELLEICDRLGMLVMDEAFDCWRRGKKTPEDARAKSAKNGAAKNGAASRHEEVYCDYARVFDDWHERDLRALIRRDRNHPCVVMWSIGNEVLEQWFSDGWKLAKRLAGIVREEDRTRPISGGFNGEIAGYSGFQTVVDAIGYNYKPRSYLPFRDKNPTVPVFGAETASSLSSRGEYFFPVSDDKLLGRADFHVSSHDRSAAPWAYPPDDEFKGLDDAPHALGEFVWTGFDYLGEPTPYNSDTSNLLNFSDPTDRERMQKELSELGKIRVPSRSSYFGIIDLAGFPKDRYYLYQARWRPDLRMAHILPHWNWPDRVGKVTPVHVYSSGDEAELFLNGKSLGRRRRGPRQYRFRWDTVRYEPGTLEVRTTRNGKPWAKARRVTTLSARALSLTPDRTVIASDGSDLCFVTVRVVDARGRTVPTAQHSIEYRLRGPGEIAAIDNGDPTSHESFQASTRRAFNGLALVILRSKRTRGGPLRLAARSEELGEATLELATEERAAPTSAAFGLTR